MLGTYKGLKKPVKVYLDSGNVDYTGGDDGRKQTEAVAAQLKRIGWREGSGGNLLHFVDETPMNEAQMSAAGLRKDKWAEAARSMHNEFYWRQRAWRALTFLFPPAN